jgi:hypothetical protein
MEHRLSSLIVAKICVVQLLSERQARLLYVT